MKMGSQRFIFILAVMMWAHCTLAASVDIQRFDTSNGVRVYFAQAMELPIVDVQVVFDAGSARDGAQSGLAQLTNRMLSQGAGDLDADAIAEGFDRLGAEFHAEALRDMAVVGLRSLSEPKYLDSALDLMALVLRAPTFPEQAFEGERGRMLIELQTEDQSPGDIATKAFYRAVYADHPYAGNPLGTAESVRALTRDAAKEFHQRFYVARNAILAIVGALSRQDAERLAERLVGRLPAGEVAPAVPPVAELSHPQTIHVDYPSSQTHILVGQPGMTRLDPDYFPLYVGNHVLGGSGLVSRLAEEIREKRGLAYSTYSYFMPMRAEGPFLMGLQTRTKEAEAATGVLFETLDRFIAEGPTAKQLEASKKNITGGFPLRVASNRDIVQNLALIGFYNLPLDYLDTFSGKVEAVTLNDIRDAFKRRIHPDRLVTVTVGKSTQ
jgi:zinc protease